MKLKRQPVDKVFLMLILIEVFFGLVILASASGPLSYAKHHTGWYFVTHQLLVGVIPGLIGLWFFSRCDFRRWERLAPYILGVAFFLMILVFIPGLAAAHGTAKSWFMIAGFSFQPTEFLKLAIVIYLAALFSSTTKTPRQAFLPSFVAFVLAAFLLMCQPDLGSLVLVAVIFLAMVFYAGAPLVYLIGTILAGASAFWVFARSASYRTARLMVFLHPELDPQGIGYQANQAVLAIGSGGFWGMGLGHSMQKYQYLPEAMGDSIFPIMAEELGFLFTILFIALFAAIVFRGLKIAKNVEGNFGRFLIIGVIAWFAGQSFLNIGGALGLLPLTGLPLPLVSYGGSATMMILCAFGIVLSISRGTART